MKPPKASFVIPAFNAEAFLAQALISCRVQSVKDIEIIVVDDGSTDGTEELVMWHKKQDERIKYCRFSHNKGRSAARNYGNSLADSPIILVLDADDMACKNRVRDTLLCFQMKNPDVVYGPFQIMDENDNVIATQKAGKIDKKMALETKKNFIGHSTMAYRKNVTLNVQYDEGIFSKLGLDDWKFQWDCVLKGYKFEVLSPYLSRYRIYSLPNQTYGSPTEFFRDDKEVQRVKDEFIAGISDRFAQKV